MTCPISGKRVCLPDRIGYSSERTPTSVGVRHLASAGTCGRGSAGRASPCQGEGRGFESRRPLGCAGRRLARRWPSTVIDYLVAPLQAGLPGGMAEWLRQGPAKPCTRVRFPLPPRALSSAGERFPDTEEATGSIPVPPTKFYQVSSMFLAARDHRPPGTLAIFHSHCLGIRRRIRPGQTA